MLGMSQRLMIFGMFAYYSSMRGARCADQVVVPILLIPAHHEAHDSLSCSFITHHNWALFLSALLHSPHNRGAALQWMPRCRA